MAFQAAPYCAKHVVAFESNGKEVVNVLNYRYATPTPDPEDIQNDGIALAEWFVETVMPQLASTCEFTSVESTDISYEGGIQFLATDGGGTAGDRGAGTSNQVALVVSLRTGFSGRSNRGRIYVPGMAEADVNGNNVDSVAVAAFLGYFNQLIGIGSPKPTVGDLVVLSRVTNGAPRLNGVTKDVTQMLINPRVDTQRRRLPR